MPTDERAAPVTVGLCSHQRSLPLLYSRIARWAYCRLDTRTIICEWIRAAEYELLAHAGLSPVDSDPPRDHIQVLGVATLLVQVYRLDDGVYAIWTVLGTAIPGHTPADGDPQPALPDEPGLWRAVQAWADDRFAAPPPDAPVAPAAPPEPVAPAGHDANPWRAPGAAPDGGQ